MLTDSNTITPIGFDELCVLLEDTYVEKSVNLGSTILHLGRHVQLGRVILVSTLTGLGACVTL
jgi:hypothetical protein